MLHQLQYMQYTWAMFVSCLSVPCPPASLPPHSFLVARCAWRPPRPLWAPGPALAWRTLTLMDPVLGQPRGGRQPSMMAEASSSYLQVQVHAGPGAGPGGQCVAWRQAGRGLTWGPGSKGQGRAQRPTPQEQQAPALRASPPSAPTHPSSPTHAPSSYTSPPPPKKNARQHPPPTHTLPTPSPHPPTCCTPPCAPRCSC